jgi:acyl-CoA synthetase (AMP-forming)/AMP-acid ligase II
VYPAVHAAATPDKPAYIMATSGETVTYAELEADSNRIAHLFRNAGLKPGDAIALCAENHPWYFKVCWAAQRAGLQYTAISSRLTVGEAEYIVNDCGAKAYITSQYKADLARDLADRMPNVTLRASMDGPIEGYERLADLIAALPTTPIADEREGGDMLYSSGTTGRPKGVKVQLSLAPMGTPNPLLSLLQLLYQADGTAMYLSPAPFYHAAPLRYCMSMMRLGATVVAMEHFDPEQALQLIERHRITHAQWVPTMFVRMLKLPDEVRTRYDVSSIKVAIHAAAPCPIPVKEQMIAWWGPVIYEYYAGTEGNGFCAITSEEWLQHRGSVGKNLLGAMHICDDEGNELPVGEAGVIFFEGGINVFEYHNDPEKTKSSRHPEHGNWSTLGDIGYVDADGYLYLTDRKANMIISGGVNIYPQEAENVLTMHPRVADVAVFGVPNEEFGEEVKAVVQPVRWSDVDTPEKAKAVERELIDFCKQQLAGLKCPRTIDFEQDLPRHPTGKLYKRLLKDRYWQGRTLTS